MDTRDDYFFVFEFSSGVAENVLLLHLSSAIERMRRCFYEKTAFKRFCQILSRFFDTIFSNFYKKKKPK